jgi:CCR4-NOT transcription complex subunit 1
VESDPAGFQNRVSTLFKNWYQICELPGANETACSQYVLHLHQTGLLKGDDTTESFFRILLVILPFKNVLASALSNLERHHY